MYIIKLNKLDGNMEDLIQVTNARLSLFVIRNYCTVNNLFNIDLNQNQNCTELTIYTSIASTLYYVILTIKGLKNSPDHSTVSKMKKQLCIMNISRTEVYLNVKLFYEDISIVQRLSSIQTLEWHQWKYFLTIGSHMIPSDAH